MFVITPSTPCEVSKSQQRTSRALASRSGWGRSHQETDAVKRSTDRRWSVCPRQDPDAVDGAVLLTRRPAEQFFSSSPHTRLHSGHTTSLFAAACQSLPIRAHCDAVMPLSTAESTPGDQGDSLDDNACSGDEDRDLGLGEEGTPREKVAVRQPFPLPSQCPLAPVVHRIGARMLTSPPSVREVSPTQGKFAFISTDTRKLLIPLTDQV